MFNFLVVVLSSIPRLGTDSYRGDLPARHCRMLQAALTEIAVSHMASPLYDLIVHRPTCLDSLVAKR